jgi:hypothetical protein
VKPQICPGGGVAIRDTRYRVTCRYTVFSWRDPPDRNYNLHSVPSIRLTCPLCKRRVWSRVVTFQDGDCVIHTLPPHKIKHWWKQGKKRSRDCGDRTRGRFS